MKIQSLGHVVLRVTDRDRAEKFYGDVLGLPICARFDEGGFKMAFFTLGNHHDFAVMEVSGDGSSRSDCRDRRFDAGRLPRRPRVPESAIEAYCSFLLQR